MRASGIGDPWAFQRLLWLVVGTVVLPTLLLAAYGMAAIRWQREATEASLQLVVQDRLDALARSLNDAVGSAEREARRAVAACMPEPSPCSPLAIDAAEVSVRSVPDAREQLGERWPAAGLGPTTTWLAETPHPLGAWQDGTRVALWRPDPDWLSQRVEAEGGRLLAQSRFALSEGDEPQGATRQLDGPLAGWTLTHSWDGEAPVGARSGFLMAAGLALLVGLVGIGTALTLYTAAREIRLSRLQTDFVSSVSHELRTPLTSIRMFVETLQSGRLQDPVRVQECLGLVANETERLSRRIERVLSWARMEAGRRVYEFEEMAPADLVTEAVNALRSQHLHEDLDVAVDVPRDLAWVRVDRDALVEALLNLLQNAVRHVPEPRKIAVEGRLDAKGRVGLSVIDDGPGIAPRDRNRIFERFVQADPRLSAPSQRGAERGSGLGLAIVRAVARAHGGAVTLVSDVGAGSRFTIWLPAADGRLPLAR